MSKRDWIERIKASLPAGYKRFEDIERDRRLKDPERLELLEAWPAKDDFERGRLATAMLAIRERIDGRV
jgi:hypothetical protein